MYKRAFIILLITSYTCLQGAAAEKPHQTITFAINNTIKRTTPLIAAIHFGDNGLKILEADSKNPSMKIPVKKVFDFEYELLKAQETGSLDAIENNETALSSAIFEGNIKYVNALVTAGATIHPRKEGQRTPSALLAALVAKTSPSKKTIAEYILNNCSDENLRDQGLNGYPPFTVLHTAVLQLIKGDTIPLDLLLQSNRLTPEDLTIIPSTRTERDKHPLLKKITLNTSKNPLIPEKLLLFFSAQKVLENNTDNPLVEKGLEKLTIFFGQQH